MFMEKNIQLMIKIGLKFQKDHKGMIINIKWYFIYLKINSMKNV